MHQMGAHKKMTLIAATAALLLSACGGGGDSAGTTTPPASNGLTLTGAAATGLAISGGTVEAKCASGTGTATTLASGNYTITISGGALPCVLKVTPTGGTPLYSAIGGSGAGSVTVNITPLTELVVAKATAGTPGALFDNFDAAAQASVSTDKLQAAVQAVATALQGIVDLSGVDPIKDTLVPATSGSAGNTLDQKLDALQAAIAAAQTTLAEITTAVATSGSTDAPVQTLLQPAASSCAGFRSGRYVAINPAETDPQWAAHTFTLDASTLTATFFDDSKVTLADNGGCSYSIAESDATTQYLVSKSGLSVGRTTYTSGSFTGKTDVSLIIPAQAIPLAELAGTWNALQYIRDDTSAPFAAGRVTLTIDANGLITSGTDCNNAGVCESFGTGATFTVNSAGGFTLDESRVFAFKGADGNLSLFILDPNTLGMVVASKRTTLALPALDTTTSYWDFSIDASGFAGNLLTDSTTVTAIDANAGTYTRRRSSDSRVDTFKINDPATGLRSRAANSCTINGATNSCAGLVTLPLVGTGLMAYYGTAPSTFFGISVNRP